MSVRACIFDLDGTLMNTLFSIAKAGNAALTALGYKEEPLDAYRYYCGDGADKLAERILLKNGDSDREHMAEASLIFRKVLKENASEGVRVYDGMPETLRMLKERGIGLAVCSNKPEDTVSDVIEELFGKGLFNAMLGQSERIPRKPAPDMALEAARRLGVSPSECLYIGDTATDMRCGSSAGMMTLGALWGYRDAEELQEGGALFLLERPEEILKHLGETENHDKICSK